MRALPVLLATLLALAPALPALVAGRASRRSTNGWPRLRSRAGGPAGARRRRGDGSACCRRCAPAACWPMHSPSACRSIASRTLDALPAPRRQAYVALADLAERARGGDEPARRGRAGRGARGRPTARAKALERPRADRRPAAGAAGHARVVPPRRDGGDLLLDAAGRRGAACGRQAHHPLRPGRRQTRRRCRPMVPRYAPAFVTAGEPDPPVEIEIVGAASQVRQRPADARGRRLARRGDGGAGAAALHGAARARSASPPRAATLATGHAGAAPRRPGRDLRAAVPRAARPAGLGRARPAGALDGAGVEHADVARDPGARGGRRDALGAALLRSAGRLAFRQERAGAW